MVSFECFLPVFAFKLRVHPLATVAVMVTQYLWCISLHIKINGLISFFLCFFGCPSPSASSFLCWWILSSLSSYLALGHRGSASGICWSAWLFQRMLMCCWARSGWPLGLICVCTWFHSCCDRDNRTFLWRSAGWMIFLPEILAKFSWRVLIWTAVFTLQKWVEFFKKMCRANLHFYIFSDVFLWSKSFTSHKDHMLFSYSHTKEKSISWPLFLSALKAWLRVISWPHSDGTYACDGTYSRWHLLVHLHPLVPERTHLRCGWARPHTNKSHLAAFEPRF